MQKLNFQIWFQFRIDLEIDEKFVKSNDVIVSVICDQFNFTIFPTNNFFEGMYINFSAKIVIMNILFDEFYIKKFEEEKSRKNSSKRMTSH